MASITKTKPEESFSKMIIKDMSHLKGKVHFPEKLKKIQEVLAPLNLPDSSDSH